MGIQCGNAGCRLENNSQEVGSERESEKKCKVRHSLIKKNKAFQKNHMKVGGGQEVSTSGHCANNDLVSSCSGTSSHEKVQIEDTDGSSIGQKEYNFLVLVHGSIWPRSRGGTFHFGHSVLGRRSKLG